MEDNVEMEQHSRSNVAMLAARGTFIVGTAAVTVTEARYSTKLVDQALCTICLTDTRRDKAQRAHCTMKLGKAATNWMVTLPQVDEDEEEAVCRVLEIRCKDLMQDDDTERKESVHVAAPDALFLNPSTDKSDNSQKTNLLTCKKTSKMVPTPDLAPAQNVVNVPNLSRRSFPETPIF